MIPGARPLPARFERLAVLVALVGAATLLAWLGYRDSELMAWLGDLPLCR